MPELMIYDDIGENFYGDGVTAKNVQAQLAEFDGDLTIRINSYGGDVFQGHAIYNLIKKYDKGISTVIVDGIAASAASIIAMAGDKVVMPINSMLMIHDPWTVSIGGSDEMLKAAETLDAIKQTIINVYSDRTGMDEGELAQMMADETWLDADQASEFGFAEKDESGAVVLNKIKPKQWINKAPQIEEIEPENVPQYANQDARRRYLEIIAEAI